MTAGISSRTPMIGGFYNRYTGKTTFFSCYFMKGFCWIIRSPWPLILLMYRGSAFWKYCFLSDTLLKQLIFVSTFEQCLRQWNHTKESNYYFFNPDLFLRKRQITTISNWGQVFTQLPILVERVCVSFPLSLAAHIISICCGLASWNGRWEDLKRLTPDEHLPDFNSLFYMPALTNTLFNIL